MKYELRHGTPSVDDYIRIRTDAGLSRKTVEAATIGLPNSLYSVCVFAGNSTVGFGRVIGDGGCFFEIVDVAVLPEHQKKGIGDMIMLALLEFIDLNAPDSAYVSLMADHGTPKFYKRFGFEEAKPPTASGMSLRINRNGHER